MVILLALRSVANQQAQLVNMMKLAKVLMNTYILALLHLHVRLKFTFFLFIKYLESILALGSYDPYNKKAELLDTNQDSWQTISDYPFE